VSNVLAHCEFGGMYVDVPYLDNLKAEYEAKIAALDKKIRTHKTVKWYEKKRKRAAFQKMIDDTNAEINALYEQGKTSTDRVIQSRIQKITNYTQQIATTNKEKDAIAPLNFASPKQLIDFLFGRTGLHLPIVKYTRDENKQ